MILMSTPQGLQYYPHAISADLLERLEQYFANPDLEWTTTTAKGTGRRVIHYISAYTYSQGGQKPTAHPLPPICEELLEILTNLGHDVFDMSERGQCIVNEYEPGQGITSHTDDINKFDDTVCCFTIYGGGTMIFKKDNDIYSLYTEPGSLYVMTGDSRYDWTHEMKKVKNDIVDGVKIPRTKRVSITFRKWI